MSELDLVSSDILHFRGSVMFIYEKEMMGCVAHGLTMFCALGLWFLMSLLVTLGLISPIIPLYSFVSGADCQPPSHPSSSEPSSPSLSTKIYRLVKDIC